MYVHFWGTVVQWKIHTAVDRTEYVGPSVQEYLLTSLIQNLFDVLEAELRRRTYGFSDNELAKASSVLSCSQLIKVDTSCGGVAVTPTMCMKTR